MIGCGYDLGLNSGDWVLGGYVEVCVDLLLIIGFGMQFYGFYDYFYLINFDCVWIEGVWNFDSVGGGVWLFFLNCLVFDVGYVKLFDCVFWFDKE